jgi:hypothetical protein
MPSANPASRDYHGSDPEATNSAPGRPLGRVLSAAQFWEIMARRQVSDDVALALIDYQGKIGKSGKRPRFRFSSRQQRISGYLPEIDRALSAAGHDPHWLQRRNRSAPFRGRTPLAYMVAGGRKAIAEVLQTLNAAALRAALA